MSWKHMGLCCGQGWVQNVDRRGAVPWRCVDLCCGCWWANIVEIRGSMLWESVGVLLWSPVVDEVGRGMWESTARTRGDPPTILGVHVVGPGLHRRGQTIALPCGRGIGSTSWRVVGLCYGGAWTSFVGLCRGRAWAWNCGHAWMRAMGSQDTMRRGPTCGRPRRPCGRVYYPPPRYSSTRRPSGSVQMC